MLNLTAADDSIEIIKMMNHTVLWDAKFDWYSVSVTHQICLYRLEHQTESSVLGLPNFA